MNTLERNIKNSWIIGAGLAVSFASTINYIASSYNEKAFVGCMGFFLVEGIGIYCSEGINDEIDFAYEIKSRRNLI